MSDEQGTLFTTRTHAGRVLSVEISAPIARTTDPATSHEAAREQTGSGRRAAHAAAVLAVVRRVPDLTYREIAARCPDIREAVEVMRRLSDLREAGEVEQGEARPCRISGRQATTWHPKE